MAFVPTGVDPTALTIAARRVLLDAFTALDDHLNALVLVGAQAMPDPILAGRPGWSLAEGSPMSVPRRRRRRTTCTAASGLHSPD